MTKIAVVILNFNGRNYLEKFLPVLLRNSREATIIVADNLSTDNSIDFLKKSYPGIPRIEIEKNLGFAGGYNRALKEVEAEFFVLLNSDIEVTDGWLQPIIQFLDSNPDYAACQPKVLDLNKRDHFEYAGASGGFLDKFGFPFCRGRLFNSIEKDNGQYDDAIDITWASGACFIIRSKAFFEMGGFDEDFFAHMEEIDLCWRLINKGYSIKCIPESIVFHIGGGTLSKTSPFKTYLNFRNGLHLLLKNLPLSSLFWKFPVRILMDWTAAAKFLIDGGPQHSLAISKAHLNVFFKIIYTLRKRTKPFRDHTTRSSVVYKHFIKKINRFSDI
jgi:GT2 family glycosyltransferase